MFLYLCAISYHCEFVSAANQFKFEMIQVVNLVRILDLIIILIITQVVVAVLHPLSTKLEKSSTLLLLYFPIFILAQSLSDMNSILVLVKAFVI